MSASNGWWNDLFQGLALDFWEQAVPEQQTQTEADFLFRALNVAAGATVLDVPCGNGRLSLALAGRGLKMIGVDLASAYVERARARAAEKGLQAEFHQRDMRDLPWQDVFDAAYCFGNSFSYFDDAGNATFLRAVARALKPGATFILDSGLTAESLFPHLLTNTWAQFGPVWFLAKRQYDPLRGILRADYTFLRDGTAETRSAFYRIYLLCELIALFEQAGFTAATPFSSFDQQPFVLGSPRLLLLVRRQ